MLLVQKYNSLAEIEGEFKEAIETLVSSEIPFLSFLERSEKEKPKEHVFYYYLFFGQSSNMPVGMALIELVSLPEKEFTPFMERMVNKIKKRAHAKWLRFGGPSKQKSFFFFEPKHQKLGLLELQKIINDMKLRDDVVVIEEWVSALSLPLLPHNEKQSYKANLTVMPRVKKNFQSYEEYFNSLSPAQGLVIKTAWKGLLKDQKFTIQDHVELSNIPSHHKLKFYGAGTITGQVIEDGEGPLTAILYIESKNLNLHVDFLQYRESIHLTTIMLMQSALMKFFEKENFEHLNFLEDLGLTNEEFKIQGLTPITLEQSLEARNEFAAGVLREDDLRRYS